MKVISNPLLEIGSVGQILIKPLQIEYASKKIRNLSALVNSRSLSFDFAYSEGDTVNQLIEYANNLKATGDAIALLMQKTADALDNTAKQFVITDQSIGAKILKG